jgi:FemAB-related protein (PEP-CTERM system-associated)
MLLRNSTLRVAPLSASSPALWDAFVTRCDDATFCHLTGWQRVVERTWGHDPHHLMALDETGVQAVLPLFHVRSALFGSMLVSTPNAVYGGVAGYSTAARSLLTDAAARLARELNVDFLELRDSHMGPGESSQRLKWHSKDLYVTFEKELVGNEEQVLKTFPSDLRRMIRVGAKSGLTTKIGGLELLDDLYRVYTQSLRNLGTPAFPRRLLAEFLQEFPRTSNILLVMQGDTVAAGVLSFYFRRTVLPYYGGSYPEFLKCGVNNFMYWELMRHAMARGCTRFDFGRSKVGTGAFAFKKGWRMTERRLPYRYLLVKATQVPNLNPTESKYQPVIQLWKRLPVSVANTLGPLIVRGLP